MRMSIAEIGRLSRPFNLVRRSWSDFRAVVLSCSFLVTYLLLDWSTNQLGPSAAVNHWHLPSGLSFALLLAYGLRYVPVVLVTSLVDDLWFHPPVVSFPVVVLQCLIMTLIHAAAAMILRRMGSGSVSLKHGRDIPRFIIASTLVSVALAAATAANLLVEQSAEWAGIINEFRSNIIGFATGILSLTPFLLILARPWFDRQLVSSGNGRGIPATHFALHRMDRSKTIFALSFLALVGVVFWLVHRAVIYEGLYVLLLFSLPLIWVAIHRGLQGLTMAVPIMTGINIVLLWHRNVPGDSAGWLQLIMLIATINAYMIGAGVNQVRFTDGQIERRDAILDAVGFAAQQFLGKSGWEGGLQDVMKRLGEATAVTRVFVSERIPDRGGQGEGSLTHEWTTPGVSTEENDRRVLNLLRGQLIDEHARLLAQGQPQLLLTQEMVDKKREMLDALSVRSAVIVPMFVDRQWWGCLGLEQCFVDREWPATEIDGLKMAGQILGTLIASVRVEQQFRQLTGNIQAVFWISAPDGRAKQYVSPGYEEIWGRNCTSLHRQPDSWLEAVHAEDQNRIFESLVKQAWGEYDEEYRVVRPDSSIRWVRDRAFPVRDQAGQVYRVVGIAEDITDQKKTEEQLRAATVLLSNLIDHLQSGVVVEDESRRITHVNQAFINMFNVPVSPQSLFSMDSRLLFVQPRDFAQRIEEVIKERTPILGEELLWQDRIFIRNYVPLCVGEEYRYHLWQYHDITVSRRAEEQIKTSLKEKEVLLKEIHHRVKNNLQIICSLLNLQSNEIEDPKACQRFKESQDRVKAMALIHERLYQSGDLARIDFAGYVRNLTGHLLRSYRVSSHAIRLNLEIDTIPMNLDVAIPCGLIINELVSNALKYAFPAGSGGEIYIRFTDENGSGLRLTVRDNGVGFASDGDPENSQSLGLKLVRSLADQLGGTVSYRNQNGFQCDIRISRHKA